MLTFLPSRSHSLPACTHFLYFIMGFNHSDELTVNRAGLCQRSATWSAAPLESRAPLPRQPLSRIFGSLENNGTSATQGTEGHQET